MLIYLANSTKKQFDLPKSIEIKEVVGRVERLLLDIRRGIGSWKIVNTYKHNGDLVNQLEYDVLKPALDLDVKFWMNRLDLT